METDKVEKNMKDLQTVGSGVEEKEEEKEKNVENKKIDINKNIVRRTCKYINDKFGLNKLKGYLYFNIHLYFIFIIGFLTFFTTSPYVLIILLNIVMLDGMSIVILHECPLTTMERKYLGITSCDMRNEFFENAGIMYKCDKEYEKQIELITNMWTIIATKCISVLFLQLFNIKLFDVGNIYS